MGYPDVPMPDNRSWESLPPDYQPTYYTADSVQRAVPNWENPDVDAVWERARKLTLSHTLLRDILTQLPLNPAGATGITGYGRLRDLGPNLSADGMITHNGDTLLIERRDTGQLAFPGGFRNAIGEDSYEDPLDAAVREIYEETTVAIRDLSRAALIYAGIAPLSLRNTDHAWIETTAYHIDISDSNRPIPTAQDDARSAGWYSLSDNVIAHMSDQQAENALTLREKL